MKDMPEDYYLKCSCGSELFKVKVIFITKYATDTQHYCAKCGAFVSGVYNDPFDELNEEGTIHCRKEEELSTRR